MLAVEQELNNLMEERERRGLPAYVVRFKDSTCSPWKLWQANDG